MAKRKIGEPSELEKINSTVLGTYTTLVVVLFLAYLVEVVKGHRTIGYFAIFAALLLIPYVIAAMIRKQDHESKLFRYVVGYGYSILYVFVIFTGNTVLTFTYIMPILAVFMLYSDMKFLVSVNLISFLSNAALVVREGIACGWEADFVTDSEIRLLVLLILGVFAAIGGNVNETVNQYRMSRLDRERGMATSMVKQMLAVSEEINVNIEKVNANMSRLGDSVQVTRDSMGEVSAGSTETAETVQTQLEMTEKIQKQIEYVKSVSNSVSTNVDEADDAIGNGRHNMDKLMRQAEASQNAARDVGLELNELTERVDEMQNIVEMIENVTSETSLLALNASIEAARAGEAGKGFAVVAVEITKLADQTSTATVSITELIRSIGIALREVVDAINTLIDSNDQQNRYATEASKNFEAISAKTDDIATLSNRLEKIIVELAGANANIVDSVQNISAITEEVSAHATETYEESESNLQIVKEVGELVEILTEKAKELSNE